jgi:hypothetical protein
MDGRRYPLTVLVFTMVLAQAATDALFWPGSRWPVSSLAYLVAASGFWVALLAGIAAISAARARKTGKDRLAYLRILIVSFLCTAAEAIITVSPLGRRAGSHQFHWTVLALALGIAAALLIAAWFILAGIYVSDAYAASYILSLALDFLARWVFWQRLAPGFGALDGEFGTADIGGAIPQEYPRAESRELRSTDSAGDLARGNAWIEALVSTNARNRRRERGPTPIVTTAGFVRSSRGRTKLAIINYFQPQLLFRALRTMPRKIVVEDQTFSVVARPWLPVDQSEDIAGDGHCWVTFGADAERHGVVTALDSIIQEDFSAEPYGDFSTEAARYNSRAARPIGNRTGVGAHVRTRASRPTVSGTVRKTDNTMKSALIDLTGTPRPSLKDAPHKRKAGIGPVRLCSALTIVDGFATEVADISRGGFYKTNPRDEPEAAAFVFLNIIGNRGDSGALVLGVKDEDEGGGVGPYLMYLGIGQLGRAQVGRTILLEQISYHWQVNTQYHLQAPYNPINAIPGQGPAGPRDSNSKR